MTRLSTSGVYHARLKERTPDFSLIISQHDQIYRLWTDLCSLQVSRRAPDFRPLLLSHQAAMDFGMGPRASPLVCGYTAHHQKLERALAELKGTEVREHTYC